MEISSPEADLGSRSEGSLVEVTSTVGGTDEAGNRWDIAQSPDRTLDLDS